ncbi:hypothetical protein [Carboxylicivirga taeanensis]|uniref:hypothetical protein n=1 Tax=Carboxylicivirga taeanensis TaxID=1416875 RepID=UPI003F6DF421
MNKNTLLILIEIVILIILLTFGILLIFEPKNSGYQSIIALTSGALLFGTDMLRRHSLKRRTNSDIKVNINSGNTIVCHYKNGKNKDLITVLFYDLNILNKSEKSFTIKEVLIEYYIGNKKKIADSVPLLTISEYSPYEKKKVDTLILNSPMGEIALLHWTNIRQEIAKNNVLSPGAILRASCSYILDIDKIEQLHQVTKFNIVVVDYNDNRTKHSIVLSEENWKKHQRSFITNNGH